MGYILNSMKTPKTRLQEIEEPLKTIAEKNIRTSININDSSLDQPKKNEQDAQDTELEA